MFWHPASDVVIVVARPQEARIEARLPKAGEVFERRYELLDVLGRGGFAIVYRALDTTMSREVAIKVLVPCEGPNAANVRKRFLREAAVFADLEDPHTITMYDFGESAEGLQFMVFEYLRSEELADVIKSGRARHPRVVTHILIQLAGALREAHQKGIFHRDIKPANVLVYEYGDDPFRVKLIDFGIAKDASPNAASLTRTGRIVGTPRYMAPEQLFGQRMGADSDIYSLGLLGFEMIAGRPAVQGISNKEILKRQVSDEPFVIPPGLVPPGLGRVLVRMLSKDRSARFQSAAVLLDELRAVMPQARVWQGEEVLDTVVEDEVETLSEAEPETLVRPAEPAPPAPPAAPRERQDEPRPRWGLAAAVGALVVGLAATLVYMRQPSKEAESQPRSVRSNMGSILAGATAGTPEHPSTSTNRPSSSPDVRPPDSPGVLPTGCGKPQAPGVHEFRYDLAPRGWVVYVPPDYDADVPHPVILMFHRSWFGAKRLLVDTQMSKTADEQHAVIVSFDSEDSMPWQAKGDLEFVFRALAKARGEFCLDFSRLYAVGDGAGGGFGERIACSLPLSAVVTTAHGMWQGDRSCDPPTPTPRLRIYGTLDKHVPIEGGTSCVPLTGPYLSAKEIANRWKASYRCSGEARPWGDYEGGTCVTWDCEASTVAECATTGGHYWPTGSPPTFDLPGCKTEDPRPQFPYREAIWDFFRDEGRILGPADLTTQNEMLDW